jgi:hypothetical protein
MDKAMNEPKSLTPVITIPTSVPFPEADETDLNNTDDDQLKYVPSMTKFVQLRVCSEFIEHTDPVAAFETSAKIAFVTDANGQLVICSIGEDEVCVIL